MTLAVAGRLKIGDLDLEIELDAAPGDVVALVGPNGAGKSSTLRAITGLAHLVDGTISVADRLVDDARSDSFVAAEDRNVGMLFQSPLIFPHLDVLDNVGFGLRAGGRSKRASRQQAQDWLERLGVQSLARRKPAELSGGQAQRVALVRALAVEPDVLLLDEPVSALDPGARDEVIEWLQSHLQSFPGATVMVSHDPAVVALLCRRVCAIVPGAPNRLGPSTIDPCDSESVALLMAGH